MATPHQNKVARRKTYLAYKKAMLTVHYAFQLISKLEEADQKWVVKKLKKLEIKMNKAPIAPTPHNPPF